MNSVRLRAKCVSHNRKRTPSTGIRALIATLFVIAISGASARGQYLGQYFAAGQFPTGSKPLGIAQYVARSPGATFVATANTGDNTVSLFRLSSNPQTGLYSLASPAAPLQASYSVQAPFGVAACDGFVVTSSTGTTISWLQFSVSPTGIVSGGELKTIVVGPQPYSAACSSLDQASGLDQALVSTAGDNTLSIVDLKSGAVVNRIANVPGSRDLHGIAVDANNHAWVAGTDANVVTVVDLGAGKVVTSFPVRQPTGIGFTNKVYVESGADNTIVAIDTNTLQVGPAVPVPANAVDFVPSVVSAGNSVAIYGAQGQPPAVVPNIAGASGLSQGALLAPLNYGIFVASKDSNSIFLILIEPFPQDLQFTNAASFAVATSVPSVGVAGGSLVTAFSKVPMAQQPQWATLVPLPPSLGGVVLHIGGALTFVSNSGWTYSPANSILAPLLFVGPNQMNFQIPPGIALGNAVPVQLTKADGTTLLSTVNIAPTGPGIFTVLQNGQGQGAVLNQNNSQNFGTNPAAPGSVIQIFATGGGDTTPLLSAGDAAPASGSPLVMMNTQPTVVTIGGIGAGVKFSGLAPGWVGLWQINAEVPAGLTPGSAVPLSVSIGGVQSNTVTIAVQ